MLDRISKDPNICHGQACVKGTRVLVYVILEALAAGMTHEQIMQEYPPLTEQDIRACETYNFKITAES